MLVGPSAHLAALSVAGVSYAKRRRGPKAFSCLAPIRIIHEREVFLNRRLLWARIALCYLLARFRDSNSSSTSLVPLLLPCLETLKGIVANLGGWMSKQRDRILLCRLQELSPNLSDPRV